MKNSLDEKWTDLASNVSVCMPVICDMNGVLRGKRLPVSELEKIASGELKLPVSTLSVDIWGRDVFGTGKVFETGDHDGALEPALRAPLILDWMSPPSALIFMQMKNPDGSAFETDPRGRLQRIIDQYAAKGLRAVCALELEFYLLSNDEKDGSTAQTSDNGGLYSLNELEVYEPFINDVYAACEAASIPIDCTISESGVGQMEINLKHAPDAMKVADDAVAFKHLIKSLANKHGYTATFMAKPFGDQPGNGMHVHFSIIDEHGANIFDNGANDGSGALKTAIGGLMRSMLATTLILAPHANSYRRLQPFMHAPVNVSWGYDNRTAAIRVPSSENNARRIEHRVGGADANPYLVLAAILGAAFLGMTENVPPPPPAEGNAAENLGADTLPSDWARAIGYFETSAEILKIFGATFVEAFAACKRQELTTFGVQIPEFERKAYLKSV